jgi:hypothetical protein
VETRACTKILETVPNPDNFIGEPPQLAAQPPLAVVKRNSKLPFYFSFLIIVISFLFI